MKQKRKVNRYTIGILDKKETRKLINNHYITELIENINKYNNNPKNKYFLGDLVVDKKERIITFNRYLKLSVPSTLEEIDLMSINLKNEHDLKRFYNVDFKNYHPPVILYRAKKRIKTLPIIYKQKYINKDYIKEKFKSYARDIKFINIILNNEQIKLSLRSSVEEFDDLYTLREILKHNNPSLVSISKIEKFYSAFITDGKNHFNYFNFRQLAIIIKTYESELKQEEKNEQSEVSGQLMLEDYARLELRWFYEELKEYLIEGDFDQSKKSLIPKHKTTK